MAPYDDLARRHRRVIARALLLSRPTLRGRRTTDGRNWRCSPATILLVRITVDLIFLADPSFISVEGARNRHTSPHLAQTRPNPSIRWGAQSRRGSVRAECLTEAQALVHVESHSGSVRVTEMTPASIDPDLPSMARSDSTWRVFRQSSANWYSQPGHRRPTTTAPPIRMDSPANEDILDTFRR